jgi:hypothetical protein
LYGVSFTDSDNGSVVGRWGTILRTINGGVTFAEEGQIDEVPAVFLLRQNYPNPFNPATNIVFSLPRADYVTLKVYNILGQKVATLVNEKKEAGTYQVQFDGTALASGVYFYRITAGEFVETRKLVLVR